MEIWFIIALLTYALFDFIIAEIIGLIITEKRYFKKSEFFVFGMMFGGVTVFLISNIVQDWVVSILTNLGFWTIVIFVFTFLANVFILAKFFLERTWKFRLVIVPLIIIGFMLLILGIYWFFIHT